MSLSDIVHSNIAELRNVLEHVDDAELNRLVTEIVKARRIVVFGVGRMGLASRAFAMRLCQLGFQASALGESTCLSVGPGDLLLIGSGSGETQVVFDVAVLAKRAKCTLAVITAQPRSRIGRQADLLIRMPGPNKAAAASPASFQPMTTLYDQSLLLLFDAVVVLLMEATGQDSDDMWRRHCNLE